MSSFDVFDTILTRRVGEPRSLFLLLGRRLRTKGLVDCSSSAFAAARTAAEVRAFANAGGLDSHVTLETIYAELTASIWIAPGTLDKVIDEELALEAEMLVPVPDGVRRVDEARAQGDRIVFTSDMYLDEGFLADLLRSEGLLRDGDHLFVSNAHAASKASGRLWDVVRSEVGEDAAITHTGNDEKSDVRSARRAGIDAVGVPENNLNRYERALERHVTDTDGLASALAGASRNARLCADVSSVEARTLVDVAAGAIAPFLIGKVLWLLGRARDEDLDALYFIARDGKLLRDIAIELAPKVGYCGELNYLYGSRQAWALPGVTGESDAILESLCPSTGDDVATTVRTVLGRAEIDPAEFASELGAAGFDTTQWDTPLDRARAEQLRRLLAAAGPLQDRLVESAERGRELALRYFDQNGLLARRSVGIVDLGTGATLFNSLSAILASVGVPAPSAFYLGLRSGVSDDGHGLPSPYLHNAIDQTGFTRTPGLLTLLEMVCTDDHGSVMGYRQTDDGVEAVFGSADSGVAAWGLATVHDAIRLVAEHIVLDPDLVPHRNIDLRPAALAAFDLFWRAPTAQEARVWGSYPFEDGWGSAALTHPIARKQRPIDALRAQPYRHWWNGGAERLSGPSTRALLRLRRTALETAPKIRARLG